MEKPAWGASSSKDTDKPAPAAPAKGLRPRLGRILEFTEMAYRLHGRPQTQSGQRLMQGEVAACILHQSRGLAYQDGVAGQAEACPEPVEGRKSAWLSATINSINSGLEK